MADHIDGPLYYETMGKSGPVIAFVHPNPMDQSCWIFQMAQISTWYRCIVIDFRATGGRRRPAPRRCWKGPIIDAGVGERRLDAPDVAIWPHLLRKRHSQGFPR
jgi:pimeloyl-ACP methyl ester carboxylesterase